MPCYRACHTNEPAAEAESQFWPRAVWKIGVLVGFKIDPTSFPAEQSIVTNHANEMKRQQDTCYRKNNCRTLSNYRFASGSTTQKRTTLSVLRTLMISDIGNHVLRPASPTGISRLMRQLNA